MALVVLTAVSGYTTGSAGGVELLVQITLGLLVLAAFSFLALPRVMQWLLPSLGQPTTVRYILAFAALLSAVLVSEAFGIDGIVGAFFRGWHSTRSSRRRGRSSSTSSSTAPRSSSLCSSSRSGSSSNPA